MKWLHLSDCWIWILRPWSQPPLIPVMKIVAIGRLPLSYFILKLTVIVMKKAQFGGKFACCERGKCLTIR